MSLLRKAIYGFGAVVLLAAVGVGGTVASVEHFCTADLPSPVVTSDFAIADQGYARPQGDSFMTFPEWYIVHAYADLAGVTEKSSESDFDYFLSIRGFWTSLCGATRQASRSGPASPDQKLTNYVIGFSFTAELGLQGAYERTLGALTEWAGGGAKTAEDKFNLALFKDYAAFLYQTPWYQFPFGERLVQFWRATPFVASIRSVERRGALSLQYAAKAAYAAAIRFAAGYDPADLTIRSVVAGLAPDELATLPGIKVIREVEAPNGLRGTLVETGRYAKFDAFVRELGHHAGTSLLEVAGNHRILVTAVASRETRISGKDIVPIFTSQIQSEPNLVRTGLDVSVRSLVAEVGRFDAEGIRLEHCYDY